MKNKKKEELHCSFTRQAGLSDSVERPCIVYLHGLTGNKNEGNKLAPLIIPLGINLLTFDFTGCGNSQSKFITLGWKETDDLQAVLDWLAENHQTSRVVLWGRSLGAVTALFYEQSHSPVSIAGLILDSTFSNFKEIADAMVEKMCPGLQC